MEEGWEFVSGYTGSFLGDSCGKISSAIQNLQDSMNEWAGNNLGDDQLGGYVAETHTSGSFNVNAALRGSNFKTHVGIDERSTLASPDIRSNWGDDYGLKFLKDATSSAKAQAKSVFERYSEYKYMNPDASIQEYLRSNNLPEDTPLSDPIYSGQVRIIPADQLETAKEYLRWKIAKESLTRPEQVARYQETLDNLKSVIEAPDGTKSVELTKEQANELARISRKGEYRAYADNFCSEDALAWQDYLGKSLKAGATAALITFTMKMAPIVIKMITEKVEEGEIDRETLRQGGLEAIPATAESFIRGGVAALFTLAYESGKLGDIFKFVTPEQVPSVIGALTVITISAIKDAFALSQHRISPQEFIARTQQTVFITAAGVGIGLALQALMPTVPFAYFIGNMVGTIMGKLTYNLIDNLFIAICIKNGYTFFGLVDQNYTLPDEVLKELNVDWNQVDEISMDSSELDVCEYDAVNLDECETDYIRMLSRGVFKVHHIGYLYR